MRRTRLFPAQLADRIHTHSTSSTCHTQYPATLTTHWYPSFSNSFPGATWYFELNLLQISMSTVRQWDTCRKHVYVVSHNRINSQTEHPPARPYSTCHVPHTPVKLPCPSLETEIRLWMSDEQQKIHCKISGKCHKKERCRESLSKRVLA